MPIKKSAVLLIILSLSSVSLLLFSASIAPSLEVIPAMPVNYTPTKCCSKVIDNNKDESPWDMISQIMLRSVA